MTETIHVVCSFCKTVNRIASESLSGDIHCTRCKRRLFREGAASALESAFWAHVERSDLPVVVLFDDADSAPEPAIAFDRASRRLEPAARFIVVDAVGDVKLAKRFAVRSAPEILLFRDHRMVGRIAAPAGEEEAVTWIAALLEATSRRSGNGG